jgi:hypothetical protein
MHAAAFKQNSNLLAMFSTPSPEQCRIAFPSPRGLYLICLQKEMTRFEMTEKFGTRVVTLFIYLFIYLFIFSFFFGMMGC